MFLLKHLVNHFSVVIDDPSLFLDLDLKLLIFSQFFIQLKSENLMLRALLGDFFLEIRNKEILIEMVNR